MRYFPIFLDVKARTIIVVGGGRTARQYQDAANRLVKLADEDVDWLGIHATRLKIATVGTA